MAIRNDGLHSDVLTDSEKENYFFWLKIRRWVMRVFVFIFLVGAIFYSLRVDKAWWALAIQIGTLVTGAIFLALYFYLFRFKDVKQSTDQGDDPIQVDEDRLIDLQNSAVHNRILSSAEARIFVRAILQPEIYRKRVTEVHVPGERTIRQKVSVEIQVPDALFRRKRRRIKDSPSSDLASASEDTGFEVPSSERFLFPIAVPAKGELSDDFVMYDSEGSALPTLSYSEYLQIVAGVVHFYFAAASRVKSGEDLPQVIQATETEAMKRIMAREVKNPRRARTERAKNMSAVTQVRGLEGQTSILKNLAELVQKLSTNYAIVALLDLDENGRSVVTYERTIIPAYNIGPFWKNREGYFKQRLRFNLGARPVDLGLSLGLASTCQSYHMVVHGSEGLYLGHQDPVGVRETLEDFVEHRLPVMDPTSPPPYFRLRKRLGQPYAHFYSRFFPVPKPETPVRLRLRFFEVPPGSVFRALVASVACSSLIWLIGFMASNAKGVDLLQTDAPAFLLAFPAVAATLLGFEKPGAKKLLEGTLAARLSLIVTAALSVAASGAFLLYRSKIVDAGNYVLDLSDDASASFLGINEIPWIALVALTLVNSFYIAYIHFTRSREYRYLISRPSKDGGATQHA